MGVGALSASSKSLAERVKLLLSLSLGALSGYLYHRFVGCRSGTCPITANPWISTLYGAILGAALSGT